MINRNLLVWLLFLGLIACSEVHYSVSSKWLYETPQERSKFRDLESSATPPELQVTNWLNSKPLTLSQLKGKVVLLDFWATWCGPCRKSIPHMNKLFEKYDKKELVIIGICHPRGSARMGNLGIRYPTAVDEKTIDAYLVTEFPTYSLIDRKGRLRIIDCKPKHLKEAIKFLLAEKD